jgi:hypothetical protein
MLVGAAMKAAATMMAKMTIIWTASGNSPSSDTIRSPSSAPTPRLMSDHPLSHYDPNASTGNYLMFKNTFANPAELEDLKRSFAVQPSWKVTLVEGESWEGPQRRISQNGEDLWARYKVYLGLMRMSLSPHPACTHFLLNRSGVKVFPSFNPSIRSLVINAIIDGMIPTKHGT